MLFTNIYKNIGNKLIRLNNLNKTYLIKAELLQINKIILNIDKIQNIKYKLVLIAKMFCYYKI